MPYRRADSAGLPEIVNLAFPGFAPNCSSNLNGFTFDAFRDAATGVMDAP
jgi:hypothetical protein